MSVCTGTRVPVKQGVPPMISGSLVMSFLFTEFSLSEDCRKAMLEGRITHVCAPFGEGILAHIVRRYFLLDKGRPVR